jgi:hypothetical protein
MADDRTRSVDSTTLGGVIGSLPSKTLPMLVAPATADEANTFKEPLVVIACWRMDDIRFEFDSSFVGPDAAEEMRLLALLRKKHPTAPLSIFGHADPVGNDVYNKTLSGRRARAIYGLLTRDTDFWEDLFSKKDGTHDDWGDRSIERMRSTLGITDTSKTTAATRAPLFRAYMDRLCRDIDGKSFEVPKGDFLGKNADGGNRGDIQGCSEFNPVLMFSKGENDAFAASANKTKRNEENSPNRRVVILFFRPGSRVDLAKWPCPSAREGIARCQTRFWSDHVKRRSFQAERREAERTRDTFACRFYDRLNEDSPCEGARKLITFTVIFQRFPGVGGTDDDRGIGDVPFTLRVMGQPDRKDKTEKDGTIKVVMPAGAVAILDFLGTSYDLSPRDEIEPLDTIKGVQRRLDMLGYHPGAIDGTVGTATDDAVLKLQADNNKDPDGDATQAVDPTKPYGTDVQNVLKGLIGE